MNQLSLNAVENQFVHSWTFSCLAQENVEYKRKGQAMCNALQDYVILFQHIPKFTLYMYLMKKFTILVIAKQKYIIKGVTMQNNF